jgi:hypothetical protein
MSAGLRIARGVLVLLPIFFLSASLSSQVPFSLATPVLGYVFDAADRGLKPIVGIPGNAMIGSPMDVAFPITRAQILPDNRHVIAASDANPELVVLHLESNPVSVNSIADMPPGPDRIGLSPHGSAAAFYYGYSRTVFIVTGLPHAPIVSEKVDLSRFTDPLKAIAINEAGNCLLLVYSEREQDSIYSVPVGRGTRFLFSVVRLGAITFYGDEDALVADSVANQLHAIRDVQGEATRVLLADSRDQVFQPVGIAVSNRNEIYVANAGSGTVVALEDDGGVLRVTECNCKVSGMRRLRDSLFQLTGHPAEPIFLFEADTVQDRIFFVPAQPFTMPVVDRPVQYF